MTKKKMEEEKSLDIPDWHKSVSEQIKKRIEDSKTFQTEQAAIDEIATAIDDYLQKSIRPEEEGKYKCLFCDKVT
jgi:hypothetical protein